MTYCKYNLDGVCENCGHTTSIQNLIRACGVAPPIALHIAHSRPSAGPGTALKRLISTIGITATPNCSCNARAAEMDALGCDWCESNIDTIVGWLREEAEKRGLPFLDIAGRLLVKRAIRNARKAAAT